MRVVQVNCIRDRQRRAGDALLSAWPTLSDIASAVRNAGADVAVVQSAYADMHLERNGIHYQFVAEPDFLGPAASTVVPWPIARAARSWKPDVIHLNGLDFPVQCRWLSRSGCPILVQDHASRAKREYAAFHRWGLSNVAGVSFTASAQAAEFREAGYFQPHTRIFAIPESSTHFTPGDQPAARKALGVYGDPLLLWVGHLNDNKDPLTILEALSRIRLTLPDAHLWCCFQQAPLLGAVLARLAAQPALAAHVHLVGATPRDKMELFYRAADFFLSGSRREGSGYALIEAMACGTTPVVSDIPSFRALTGNGRIGALATPGDADAFAAALIGLAARAKAERHSETLAHFAAELSFDVIGARLLDAYRSLTADQGMRPS